MGQPRRWQRVQTDVDREELHAPATKAKFTAAWLKWTAQLNDPEWLEGRARGLRDGTIDPLT